ncbi:MAG: ECF transporter S component [Sedimentibacter sp.]|uniref:ECF transporter S component n=1 Tax=Sedimentibacter sp. TaxID=1960295 RepID=UPI0031586022
MQEKLFITKGEASGKKAKGLRTAVSAFIITVLIPVTIWFGVSFLNDRKYYFISLMIIIYVLVPFFMMFENRQPQAREIIVISVLSSAAVAGRAMFFMIPAFKPMIAIVAISGVVFGPESGFVTGALSAFASNFIFGQGPWTPWQMISLGLIGFAAGTLHKAGVLKKRKFDLCVFGCLSTYMIYGGIMNFASVAMYTSKISKSALMAAYISGIPYDTIHAFSTVFFMHVLSVPMIERLDRIKLKYGMMRKG